MTNTFLNKFYDPLADAAGAATSSSPAGMALAAGQSALGLIQTINASNKLKKLSARRTSYKTPEEYYQLLQATQSLAQQGFDPVTLNYLTNQTDRAFSSSIDAATRLGADPNQLSAIFDQKMQGIMKIGAENHQLNMENFSRYLGAKDVIGQNKVAEFNSQQDILKDQMQALGVEKQAGIQNIGSGANAFISMDASNRTSRLYTDMLDALKALKK